MNRSILIFVYILLALSSFGQKIIEVQNNTADVRTEVIAIPYNKFSKHFGTDTIFTIYDHATGSAVIHQIEKRGTPFSQNILIQVTVPPKQAIKLVVKAQKTEKFVQKTFARYIPERLDDFAWENDIVAFRLYGKALEGTTEDAQGIDYWAKRTKELIIDKWYKHGDYHKDHGEGQDYYSVGQTLGAGDIALYSDNNVFYTKHYREYKILDNGPLRTTFRLTFDRQEINGNFISLTKTISLDAGEHFNKITVNLQNETSPATAVVLGIAKRKEDNPRYDYDAKEQRVAYWEPAIADYGQSGIALIVPQNKGKLQTDNPQQFLLHTTIKNNIPLVYYNGAAWNKAGHITDSDAWFAFVKKKADRIKKPLHVKLK